MVAERHFTRTRRLALKLAGIELFERHRALLDRRGHRLGLHNEAAWGDLLDAAEDGNPDAVRRLLALVTTGFTGFFRHPHHFQLAARHALQAAERRGSARLWSAAAATGEEAYSIAIACLEVFAPFAHPTPPVQILATDLDVDALAGARHGAYATAGFTPAPGHPRHQTATAGTPQVPDRTTDTADPGSRGLDPARRDRFFTPTGDGRWQVIPAVRALVEFQLLNLAAVTWPVAGPFDVIFCRNVLMYLESGHRYAVLERMASLLAPDGLLLLDPAEHLGSAAHLFLSKPGGAHGRRLGA